MRCIICQKDTKPWCLVENKNFMDNFNEINKLVKNNIKYKFQKDILSLHKILIFKRK